MYRENLIWLADASVKASKVEFSQLLKRATRAKRSDGTTMQFGKAWRHTHSKWMGRSVEASTQAAVWTGRKGGWQTAFRRNTAPWIIYSVMDTAEWQTFFPLVKKAYSSCDCMSVTSETRRFGTNTDTVTPLVLTWVFIASPHHSWLRLEKEKSWSCRSARRTAGCICVRLKVRWPLRGPDLYLWRSKPPQVNLEL